MLFILSTLPVVLICWYIYSKDRNKEPMQLLARLFLKGIASCFLVIVISEAMELLIPFLEKDVVDMKPFEVLFYSFIGVALVEESCKWYFVNKVGYNSRCFDEKYDIIVYAVFVSLGFAFFENMLYVFTHNSVSLAISRALLAVPGHACDSVFMGYYLTVAKQASLLGNKEQERLNKINSILVPTILHGIYDFCLFINKDEFMYIFYGFVIFLYVASLVKIKQLTRQNKRLYRNQLKKEYKNRLKNSRMDNYIEREKLQQVNLTNSSKEYCTNCGAVLIGPYCMSCGKRK
jgi:RsiW-degrading membrane proteinase PrsW (M82 family)